MALPLYSARRTPAPRAMLDRQAGFAAGLVLGTDTFSLPANAILRAENIDLSDDGLARKRRGTAQTSVAALTANPVQHGTSWTRFGLGTLQAVVANGTLYTTTLPALGVGATWTARTGALSTSVTPHFAAFEDATAEALYIADGGALNKYLGAGTVAVNLAGTPAAVDGLVVYNQRLIGWHGTTVYWSGLQNGDSLGNPAGGGGEAVIQTFGDREIVGAGTLAGTLFLLHATGISTFTGLSADDISIGAGADGLTSDVGCVARLSVVATDDALYFLSSRGFYALTAAGLSCISTAIDPVLRDLPAAGWANVRGVHARARRQVRWWLPGVGVYVFAYRANGGVAAGGGAWSGPWTGGYRTPDTTALWESEDAAGAPLVLRGSVTGTVERCDVLLPGRRVCDTCPPTLAPGGAITVALRCRPLTHGDLGTTKSYRFARLTADLAGSTQATLRLATSSGSGLTALTPLGADIWGSTTWGGGEWTSSSLAITPYRVPGEGTGPYADVTFADSSDRETVVAAVELEALPAGRRRTA